MCRLKTDWLFGRPNADRDIFYQRKNKSLLNTIEECDFQILRIESQI